jgi:hypothetical protein
VATATATAIKVAAEVEAVDADAGVADHAITTALSQHEETAQQ